MCLLHLHCSRHAGHPSIWVITDAALHAASQPRFNALRGEVVAQLEADLREAAGAAVASGGAASAGASSSRKRHFTPAEGDTSAAPMLGLPGGGLLPAPSGARSREARAGASRPAPLTMEQLRLRTIEETRVREQRAASASSSAQQRAPPAAMPAPAPASTAEEQPLELDEDPYTRRRTVGMLLTASSGRAREAARLEEEAEVSVGGSAGARAEWGSTAAAKARAGAAGAAGAAPRPPSAQSSPEPPQRRPGPSALEGAPGASGSPPAEPPLASRRSRVATLLQEALRAGRDLDVRALAEGAPGSRRGAGAPPPAAFASPAAALSAAGDAQAAVGALSALSLPALAAVGAAVEAALHASLTAGSLPYADRARALITALRERGNAALRRALLGGEVAPSWLATCEADELAPGE